MLREELQKIYAVLKAMQFILMFKNETRGIHSRIARRTLNHICYLKCNMATKTATYLQNIFGYINVEFKSCMNQHTSECSGGISSCKCSRHIFRCGIINGNPWDLF